MSPIISAPAFPSPSKCWPLNATRMSEHLETLAGLLKEMGARTAYLELDAWNGGRSGA
jgi:hypothetical protein